MGTYQCVIFDFVRVANLLNKDSVTIDDYNQYGNFHATTLTRRFNCRTIIHSNIERFGQKTSLIIDCKLTRHRNLLTISCLWIIIKGNFIIGFIIMMVGEKRTMVSKNVTITCQYGLHMLPSVMLSDKLGSFYCCKTIIHYKDKDINEKNVVELMANYLKCGSEVTLICDGEREEEALAYFSNFIENELNELPQISSRPVRRVSASTAFQ